VIVGNPAALALESGITEAYARLSFRALGFFVIHVGGRSYGVRSSDATMLACSFDQVKKRIVDRGGHTAAFATEVDPGNLGGHLKTGQSWSLQNRPVGRHARTS